MYKWVVIRNFMKGVKPNYTKESLIDLVNAGKTVKEIAAVYEVCSSSIGRAMRKMDITYNLQVRKIDKDHNFFETIDSEIKAYLLGFLIADGCVYDKNRFGLCITEDDGEIIKYFVDFIAPTSLVKKIHNTKGAVARRPQLFLRIGSEKIVKDLAKYGVVPRKTYKPIKLPNISDELVWHVIRGIFDGDGCVSYHDNHGLKNLRRINIVNGDPTIIYSIRDFLLSKGIKCTTSDRGSCFTLNIDSQEHIFNFGTNIYKNSNFYLKRKFTKFDLGNTELNGVIKRLHQRNA